MFFLMDVFDLPYDFLECALFCCSKFTYFSLCRGMWSKKEACLEVGTQPTDAERETVPRPEGEHRPEQTNLIG